MKNFGTYTKNAKILNCPFCEITKLYCIVKVEEEGEGENKTKNEDGGDEPREQHNVLEVAAELTRLSEAFGQGT